MAERSYTRQRWGWHNLGTPLLTATVAAFSGRLGDGAGNLSFDKFNTKIVQALPTIEKDKRTGLLKPTDVHSKEVIRVSVWGARNLLVNHLEDAGPLRVGNMTHRMVELGANDGDGLMMANDIVKLHDTRHRYKIGPMLELLSLQVVEHSLELPPQFDSAVVPRQVV
jgi:hypothetical protein